MTTRKKKAPARKSSTGGRIRIREYTVDSYLRRKPRKRTISFAGISSIAGYKSAKRTRKSRKK